MQYKRNMEREKMETLHVCWQPEVDLPTLYARRDDIADVFTVQGIGRFRGEYIFEQKGLYVVYCWDRQLRRIFDIGKTYDQTFAKRLKQHLSTDNYLDVILQSYGIDAANKTMVKVGILKDQLSRQRIADIENLLIYHHPTDFNRRSTKSFRTSRAFTLINSGEYFPPFSVSYDSDSASQHSP
jgi:hypothetical protein